MESNYYGLIVCGTVYSHDGDVAGNNGYPGYRVVKLKGDSIETSAIIANNNAASLSLYPNPANNDFNLQLQTQSTTLFTIISLPGITIFEKSAKGINGYLQEVIPVDQNFSEGMYLVKVSNEQHQWTKPLLIAR